MKHPVYNTTVRNFTDFMRILLSYNGDHRVYTNLRLMYANKLSKLRGFTETTERGPSTHLYNWKLACEASIATLIGPTVATADCISVSLLLLMSTNPVSVAPTSALLNLHCWF